MNKTQINYFKERVDTVDKIVQRKYKQRFPFIEDHSLEEMIGMIVNSQVRFREEEFRKADCPRLIGEPKQVLSKLFEFPGEEEIKSKNERIGKLYERLINRISQKFRQLVDEFVLERIEDPAEKLREMENKEYLTQGELNELERIYNT